MAAQDAVLRARRRVSQCKRCFHSLKCDVIAGLHEASDAFQSISSSLMRLVAVKSEQLENEGRSFSSSSPISSRTEAGSGFGVRNEETGSDLPSDPETEQEEQPVNELVDNLSKITRLFDRQARFSQEIIDRVQESIENMKDCLASELESRPLKRAHLEEKRGILIADTIQSLEKLEMLFRQSLTPNLEFLGSEELLDSLATVSESIYQLNRRY